MPWYWSDELAAFLSSEGRLDVEAARRLANPPVAYRSESDTVEDAARELIDDGEIPLAA